MVKQEESEDGMLRFTQFAGVSFVRSWDPLQAFLLIYCDKRVENCSRRCLNFSDKPRRVVVYVKTTRNSRKAEKTAMDRCKMTELQRYHYAVWVKKAAGNKQMPSVCQLVCSVFHLPCFFSKTCGGSQIFHGKLSNVSVEVFLA